METPNMKLTILVLLSLATLCDSHGNWGAPKKGKCYEYVQKDRKPNCCDREPLFDPCSNVTCESGSECVVHHTPQPGNCENDFPTRTSCDAPCPLPSCLSYCVPIRKLNGCPGCYCNKTNPPKNPCLELGACSENEQCVLQEVICGFPPCFPVKECQPKCVPDSVCPKNCYRYKDEYGCEKCHCCNNCVNTKCGPGEKCVLDPLICITCPCPVLATCVQEDCEPK